MLRRLLAELRLLVLLFDLSLEVLEDDSFVFCSDRFESKLVKLVLVLLLNLLELSRESDKFDFEEDRDRVAAALVITDEPILRTTCFELALLLL